MATNDTSYSAKNAAPLVNPTSSTIFTVVDTNAQPTKAAAIYFNVPQLAVAGTGTSTVVPQVLTFLVTAAGRVVGGTTTNFQPIMYYGNSVTAGSNTAVASPSAAAYNSTSGNWIITAQFIFDPTSGVLNGNYYGNLGSGGALISQVATTQITGKSAATTLPFTVSGLFSSSNAGNIAYLDSFEVEVV